MIELITLVRASVAEHDPRALQSDDTTTWHRSSRAASAQPSALSTVAVQVDDTAARSAVHVAMVWGVNVIVAPPHIWLRASPPTLMM